jgi:hypothetical protein
VQIADGRRFRLQVGGNQTEERFLGIGNGDGIVNPGESFLVLPKDQGEFRLTCLYTGDPYVNPAGLDLRYSDYWGKYDHVGGSAKYSMPTVAANCPPGHELVFFAEYWLPNAPEHTIRRSLVRVRVQGKDQTAPQARWAQVSPGNLLEAQLIEGAQSRLPTPYSLASISPRFVWRLNSMTKEKTETGLPEIASSAEPCLIRQTARTMSTLKLPMSLETRVRQPSSCTRTKLATGSIFIHSLQSTSKPMGETEREFCSGITMGLL